MNRTVPPYCGQDQPGLVAIPRAAFYQQGPEEGPWVMPPYAALYPPAREPVSARALVPPPLFKTDLWSAMQTWPL